MSELRSRILSIADSGWESHGLSLLLDEDHNEIGKICYQKEGSCTSPEIDSGIPGCRWHCIDLDADIPKDSRIDIILKISDDRSNWKDLVGRTVTSEDLRYVPISAIGGRYLKLVLTLHKDGEDAPVLRKVTINYPRPPYLSYLPALYQDDSASKDFLERFLSIFESEMYDLEETISRIPDLFDPSRTPERFVPWLAEWLSLDLYQLLGEKNRAYILRARGFYGQKGTAPGLASLVSFLTGNKCCVKEYMNNVFRSFGREHEEAKEVSDTGCTSFYHQTSLTVNTKDGTLLSDMGTYYDRVHYTVDTSNKGLIAPNVVGLFIFISCEPTIDKEELKKIIDSFLPIFVRVEIFLVELWDEAIDENGIQDAYKDLVQSLSEEFVVGVSGSYKDTVSWNWLLTYKKGSVSNDLCEKGRTNNLSYRTPQSNLITDNPL